MARLSLNLSLGHGLSGAIKLSTMKHKYMYCMITLITTHIVINFYFHFHFWCRSTLDCAVIPLISWRPPVHCLSVAREKLGPMGPGESSDTVGTFALLLPMPDLTPASLYIVFPSSWGFKALQKASVRGLVSLKTLKTLGNCSYLCSAWQSSHPHSLL